ncbi:hypothetical protein KP79_PYT22884 [Mizuhopecten yessoensis]|uniref:RING-type domain-containing protein n=1 Tax=Mizuhopecten yessoensis TaxID=6573 RepID=A0A210QKQ8_MIZYE|nr:hypothetical protein KP79_PYT22884 [Mizuhopecten yessoensis]
MCSQTIIGHVKAPFHTWLAVSYSSQQRNRTESLIQPTEQHNPTGEQQQIEPSNFIDLIQPTEQHNPTGEQQQIEPSNVMLQGPTDQDSPVTVKMPRMPACGICRDRYCDSFFNPCGHLVCLVCAVELEERHQHCHICRQDIDKINPLYL